MYLTAYSILLRKPEICTDVIYIIVIRCPPHYSNSQTACGFGFTSFAGTLLDHLEAKIT